MQAMVHAITVVRRENWNQRRLGAALRGGHGIKNESSRPIPAAATISAQTKNSLAGCCVSLIPSS
jgi:hypothetical protein